jgi:hypothetical protein
MTNRAKSIVGITLAITIQVALAAQNLTVHVVTDSSNPKPASGISVQLFPQPRMSGSRRLIREKSDKSGTVVFQNIDLTSIAWVVGIDNLGTVATDPAVILCRPENLFSQGFPRDFVPAITSLPAEITFHIRKRGFKEQMQYLFVIP